VLGTKRPDWTGLSNTRCVRGGVEEGELNANIENNKKDLPGNHIIGDYFGSDHFLL